MEDIYEWMLCRGKRNYPYCTANRRRRGGWVVMRWNDRHGPTIVDELTRRGAIVRIGPWLTCPGGVGVVREAVLIRVTEAGWPVMCSKL